MKQSIFKKEVFASGSQSTVKAEIVATMNYTSNAWLSTDADSKIVQPVLRQTPCKAQGGHKRTICQSVR